MRQLARQKWERQQARRTERRSRARKRAIVAGAVAGILAIGAGGYGVTLLVKDDRQANAAPTTSPEPEPSAADTPTAAAAPRPTKPGECTFVAQGDSDQKSVGVPGPSAPVKDAVATITTSRGTVTADLLGTKASCAVHSFTFLAGKNALDNKVCTGLAVKPAPARYLECGDLTGSGGSGPGYIFGNENDDKSTVGARLARHGGGRKPQRQQVLHHLW